MRGVGTPLCLLSGAACWRHPAGELSFHENTHTPYSRDDDAYLWRHRDDELQATADVLGRGTKSVVARLDRLRDSNSDGYRRLFGRDEDDDGEGKKAPLRPVREVLQRVIWDDSLAASDFSVGYRDRFAGETPLEAAFDAPNTSVKGSERLFVLALPEHRIEYIKFKRRLVWHKQQRLDRVLGSGRGDSQQGAAPVDGPWRLSEVVDGYAAWNAARAAAARRARAEAVASLGSSEALSSLLALLKQARDGQLSAEAFAEAALSDEFFGIDGMGAAEPTAPDDGPGGPPRSSRSPLVALLEMMPEEHSTVRAALLAAVGERLGGEHPSASAATPSPSPRPRARRAGAVSMRAEPPPPGDATDDAGAEEEPTSRTTTEEEAAEGWRLDYSRQARRNGGVVLGVLGLAITWAFSVPPDIRRTVVCANQQEFGQATNGCVDASVLRSRVVEHYRTCGRPGGAACVAFDLSIDPKSRAAFDANVDLVQGVVQGL